MHEAAARVQLPSQHSRQLSQQSCQRGSAFPLLFALAFSAAAALLFVTGTLPALRERDTLRDKHADLARIQHRLESALANWRGREQAMDEDIETLLVEIDKLGLLPEELVAEFKLGAEFTPGAGRQGAERQGAERQGAERQGERRTSSEPAKPSIKRGPEASGNPRSFSAGGSSKRP